MYTYLIWARFNAYQTVNTIVWAENDWSAKHLAEAEFGVGNMLNFIRTSDLS